MPWWSPAAASPSMPLTEMTDGRWQVGLQSKLMGQINLTPPLLPT